MTTIPVAVITNGSLLYRDDVRSDLLAADAVLPTLVAGDAELYRAINRPWQLLLQAGGGWGRPPRAAGRPPVPRAEGTPPGRG